MWSGRLLAATAAAAGRSAATPSTSGRAAVFGPTGPAARAASTRVTVRLTTAVDGLGGPGEAATVRPGHARNFLIPQGLAVMEVAAGGRQRRREKEVRERRGEGGGVVGAPQLEWPGRRLMCGGGPRRRSSHRAGCWPATSRTRAHTHHARWRRGTSQGHNPSLSLSLSSSPQATTAPSASSAPSAAAPAANDAAAAQRRLASVVRQLTRGEVVRVGCKERGASARPLQRLSLSPGADPSSLTQAATHPPISLFPLPSQEIVRASTARDGSFTPPIGLDEIVAALADQKRIALDPALFALPPPSITRQGRHQLPLRILTGGGGGGEGVKEERVVLRVAVGAAAAGPEAGEEAAGEDKKKGGGGGKK